MQIVEIKVSYLGFSTNSAVTFADHRSVVGLRLNGNQTVHMDEVRRQPQPTSASGSTATDRKGH